MKRSHFTLTLRITNPVWWIFTFRSRRRERLAEENRQRRLRMFYDFVLEPEYVEYRYSPDGRKARPEAPVAPIGTANYAPGAIVRPKEVLDVEPERVVVRGTS